MSKTISLSLLDQVQIASPCHVPWESMQGDDLRRHCDSCHLTVHNLSAMSRADAEAFLIGHASKNDRGRLCVRLYRRFDGTVLTSDCPVGLARLRAHARRAWGRVAAAIACILTIGAWSKRDDPLRTWMGFDRLRSIQPFASICDYLRPIMPPGRGWGGGGYFAGDIAPPSPPFRTGVTVSTNPPPPVNPDQIAQDGSNQKGPPIE